MVAEGFDVAAVEGAGVSEGFSGSEGGSSESEIEVAEGVVAEVSLRSDGCALRTGDELPFENPRFRPTDGPESSIALGSRRNGLGAAEPGVVSCWGVVKED